MADDYIAALELERDNATLMANDMARRIRVMDTQNNGDPDLINGTAQDRIQMQAVVQIYTDRMDNLNAKIARAHQIRQANAPTIQMPPDLPAAPAGQAHKATKGIKTRLSGPHWFRVSPIPIRTSWKRSSTADSTTKDQRITEASSKNWQTSR